MEVEQRALIDALTFTTEIVVNLTDKLSNLEDKIIILEKNVVNIKEILKINNNNNQKLSTKINELIIKTNSVLSENILCDSEELNLTNIDNKNYDETSENNKFSDPTTINQNEKYNLNNKKGGVMLNTLIKKRIEIENKITNNLENIRQNINEQSNSSNTIEQVNETKLVNSNIINKRTGRKF